MRVLTKTNTAWLQLFREKHARSPKVLHIGNVANNAYINAKILNKAGLENHVLSYDSPFVMSCPEWEDAHLTDAVENLFDPNWKEMNLRGFKRPKWFAGGKFEIALYRLHQLHNKNKKFDLVPFARMIIALTLSLENLQKIKKILSPAAKILKYMDRVLGSNTHTHLRKLTQKTVEKIHRIKVVEKKELGISLEKILSNNIALFASQFSDRTDKLEFSDLVGYQYRAMELSDVFAHYDIIIAYAYDGIYPLLANRKYFSFEHGTIRDIPYENSQAGRICSLVYKNSQHAFVTNLDCVNSAKFLCGDSYTEINHPFDETTVADIKPNKAERRTLCAELDSDFLIFHPTRHDWIGGQGFADKANNLLIQAIGELRKNGYRVGLICCEWGNNVLESMKLVDDYQITKYVKWVKPVGTVRFIQFCKTVDLVADQFKLGAFGGVTFKAMASGVPVMTYLNEELCLSRYHEMLPVVNCKTQQDIYDKIAHLCQNKDLLVAIGIKSKAWIYEHHSMSETVNRQVDQFRIYLDKLQKKNCENFPKKL